MFHPNINKNGLQYRKNLLYKIINSWCTISLKSDGWKLKIQRKKHQTFSWSQYVTNVGKGHVHV
jgi:hypothetical protein